MRKVLLLNNMQDTFSFTNADFGEYLGYSYFFRKNQSISVFKKFFLPEIKQEQRLFNKNVTTSFSFHFRFSIFDTRDYF